MQPALPDVNVLIALIDPEHQFHEAAHQWFGHNRRYGWATCPVTQNGCVRIMSNPGYPFPGLTAERVSGILRELIGLPGHVFWPDSLSILDEARFRIAGTSAKQLTDIYLLGLAVANDGRLATFDRSIQKERIIGFEERSLEVIGR